jgi:hypothetical protein
VPDLPGPTAPTAPPGLPPSACEGLVGGLVVRCGRGETDAMGTLFDLLYGVVAATLRRRVPARDVDDAVVEVFQEVWRAAHAFRAGQQDPIVWVLRIADGTARPAPPAMRPALVAS